MLLSIKNLSVSIEDNNILNDFSLDIKEGEVHAIMGPNGSGKSTLSNVLAGKEEYKITSGEIQFKDKNLFDLNIEERSQEGLFLAFQYPVAIPGVSITPFLQTAMNSKLKAQGKEEVAKRVQYCAKQIGDEAMSFAMALLVLPELQKMTMQSDEYKEWQQQRFKNLN